MFAIDIDGQTITTTANRVPGYGVAYGRKASVIRAELQRYVDNVSPEVALVRANEFADREMARGTTVARERIVEIAMNGELSEEALKLAKRSAKRLTQLASFGDDDIVWEKAGWHTTHAEAVNHRPHSGTPRGTIFRIVEARKV